ncbi:hypothetical protein GOP47_0003367 [Adiantum capillus-veneris]|uniref:Terpene cyclase/mutase family member n=1 Tax=Adiantum capillus-veneris TaxID=13818 RepID=A0A9D4VC39_ADICA|nr:hypothetical protein GOP47_0003367 [Adiantum capillus-veneris]
MDPYNQEYFKEEYAGDMRNIEPISLDEGIRRSQEFLLSVQFPEGYWCGELEANTTITSQTIIFYKMLGIDDQKPMQKMGNYLKRRQCDHGGWELYYGDGGHLSATIEAYIALSLLHVPKTDPILQKAYEYIISGGGISKARIFTKILLALIGVYDWKGIPSLPPWVVLFPGWFPFSIYDMSCWARGCVVPLMIIFDKKPVFKLKPEMSFDELYAEGRKNVRFSFTFEGSWTDKLFVGIDYTFKAMEKMGLVPFRRWGLKEAERWVLKRQEDSGEFLGYYPPMFYAMICMKIWGYDVTHPVFHRALSALEMFTIERKEHCVVQSAISPVWDTAFVVRALVESGLPPDHPALQKAGEWLLEKQITKHGDWSYQSKTGYVPPGGWAFQFFNRWYPDVDDTAAVAMALNSIKLKKEDVKNGAIACAVDWLNTMQSSNGGWGAFDIDNDKSWLNSLPFGDLKAMNDPPTADVSARVVELVGRLMDSGHGETLAQRISPKVLARGLSYLRNEQEEDGCWWGRWGVNYIYGTCGTLMAMALTAPTTHEEEIRRGAKWLVKIQNQKGKEIKWSSMARPDAGGGWGEVDWTIEFRPEADGGWGETCFSYNDKALKYKNEGSTASQTAWALQGLLAAGDALGKYEEEAIEQGVEYLLAHQRKDGSWQERPYTGVGFPRQFMLRYHLYSSHFPLSALSRYRDRLHARKFKVSPS